ncbi:TPA: hypothetical protein ACJHHW_002053 [Staphylococcus pseudintermedius]|nr:hypothetical protein [Staphylococcus pseudintermedius]MDK3663439.1 hypothetical protein [Staphylococcus pseudintermedius]
MYIFMFIVSCIICPIITGIVANYIYDKVKRLPPTHKARVASISVKGEKIHLGRYKDEIECAKAYNSTVIRYWNGNGYLNEINHKLVK